MSDFGQYVPAHIRKLAENNQSKPLKQSSSKDKPLALNLNENPFGPSPLALKAIEAALSDSHRYPEIQASVLHEEIAAFHGVKPEQVLVTAGATELLGMIARTLLAPGLTAITSARSFIVYKLATQVTEGRLIEVAPRENGYDLDAVAKTIDANTRIVFVANPNNPTGTMVAADEVDDFLEKIPDHVLVVLDEAYGDFAERFAQERGVIFSRALEYIREDRNVILLTQAAATAALRDQEHIRIAVDNNTRQAEVLSGGLKDAGLPVARTWANFLYCELGTDAAGFAERLQAEGVVVQPLGLWGAPTAIRISIGTPEQNQRFLKALIIVQQ